MMKKTTLVLALATTVVAANAQAPQFKQVARIDVSAFFTGSTVAGNQGGHGSFIGGITSDGSNIYLSGWSSAGGAQRTGVVKISNPLSSPSTSSFAQRGGVAGGSRQTKLQWANNSLYHGYGMGNAGATDNGIQRLDAAGNVLFDVNGAAITGLAGTRFDSFHVTNAGIMSTTLRFNTDWNSPRSAHLADATTGLFSSGYTFAPATPGGSNSFRDMVVDGTGQLFTKRGTFTGGIQGWNVSGSTISGPVVSSNIPGTASTNAEEKLGYGDAVNGGGVKYDRYLTSSIQMSTTLAPRSNIQIISPDGLFGTFNLNGAENGFAQFGSTAAGFATNQQTFLNAQSATINGKRYLLVAESMAGTAGDYVRIYEAVPEPGTMAALGLGVAAMLRRRKKA